MNIEQVLKQFGYSLRPISDAPRDGRKIFGISERRGLVICCWDVSALKFAGGTWLEVKDAECCLRACATEGSIERLRCIDIAGATSLLFLIAWIAVLARKGCRATEGMGYAIGYGFDPNRITGVTKMNAVRCEVCA
jgi:hypothetical protein